MKEEKRIETNSLKAWLLAARPKTLTGAAVPVMIGVALAYVDAPDYGDDVFSWLAAALCLLFAFIMQIDANLINDFFDFANGTDDVETRLGPRRACAMGWVKLDSMKKAIAGTTCLACLVGLPLVWYGGLEMILVGLLCVLFCFLYTTHLSYMGLGDLLVLLFFGLIPVCGTYYILAHEITTPAILLGLIAGISIDALLVGVSYACLGRTDIVGDVLVIGAVTAVISAAGCFSGRVFGDRLGNRSSIVGGAVLLAIAVKIIFYG